MCVGGNVSPLFCAVVVCVLVGCWSIVLYCSCMCYGGAIIHCFVL